MSEFIFYAFLAWMVVTSLNDTLKMRNYHDAVFKYRELIRQSKLIEEDRDYFKKFWAESGKRERNKQEQLDIAMNALKLIETNKVFHPEITAQNALKDIESWKKDEHE